MATRFSELVQAAATLDRRAYIAKFPHPVLLALSSIELADGTPLGLGVTPVAPPAVLKRPSPRPGTATYVGNLAELRKPAPQELDPLVLFVAAKSGGREVSVGRGETSDILLDDETVSRDHAVFTQKNEWWTLADRGSRNGTIVNGETLSPNQAVPLGDGARIRFGKVYTFIFQTALAFYAEINGLAI